MGTVHSLVERETLRILSETVHPLFAARTGPIEIDSMERVTVAVALEDRFGIEIDDAIGGACTAGEIVTAVETALQRKQAGAGAAEVGGQTCTSIRF